MAVPTIHVLPPRPVYEYRVFYCGESGWREEDSTVPARHLAKVLNECGAEGWSIAWFSETANSEGFEGGTLLLQRPVRES